MATDDNIFNKANKEKKESPISNNRWWDIVEQMNFLSSYKEKYNKSLKILWYYFSVLVIFFFLSNFTDFFAYKVIFSSNQTALNQGLDKQTKQIGWQKKNQNGALEGYISQRYQETLAKYKKFFWVGGTHWWTVSWYYCVSTEWIIKQIKADILKQDINNINIRDGYMSDINKKQIDKVTTNILVYLYSSCGRGWDIFRIKYNDVYDWNVMMDVLSIGMSWNNANNILKLYKYSKSSWLTVSTSLKKTIQTYYPDVYKQLDNTNNKNNDTIDWILYSAQNIISSSDLKISLFENEISDIKMWYDWDDNLSFFSKLAWISEWLYDLSAFNIKWTFKYLFDSILYKLPIVSFMYLNITSFIITGILTVFLFFLLDMLPMSMLALSWYFKIENILFYIINFFYTLIYYFIEIVIVIFVISKIIWFFINVV